MDDGNLNVASAVSEADYYPLVSPPFIAPDVLRQVDPVGVKERLTKVVEALILPRLLALHKSPSVANDESQSPSRHDVANLARLALDPDVSLSSKFVQDLKDGGLSSESLFINLLEPAARYLGTMWDNDECDFVEVTLAVGRLQQLLALFNCSIDVPALTEKRRVCMIGLVDEQHSFGLSMVEKFLRAGGWSVHSERGTTLEQVAPLMATEWFAVVGLSASSDRQLKSVAETIREIRLRSRNPMLGIMVGGPPFTECPELAESVGADATAVNALAAVLLAQKLFDAGARTNWQGSYDRK
jgi:methanogenic corrinoid protein MtbC1